MSKPITPPDPRDIVLSADLCVRAYQTFTHSRKNSEGLLADSAFAVRGTTTAFGQIVTGDWGMNALALPWRSGEYPELGWCHKGFLRGSGFDGLGGALGLWKVAKADLLFGDPKLICGHSKGGAEAFILAALLVIVGKPPRALITFGAPKFTTTANIFYLLRNIPQAHFLHGSDIVPSVPATPWWRQFDRIRLNRGREHRISDAITDHFMSAYRGAARAAYGAYNSGGVSQ